MNDENAKLIIEQNADLFRELSELKGGDRKIHTTVTCPSCGKEFIVKKAERDQVKGCPFCGCRGDGTTRGEVPV